MQTSVWEGKRGVKTRRPNETPRGRAGPSRAPRATVTNRGHVRAGTCVSQEPRRRLASPGRGRGQACRGVPHLGAAERGGLAPRRGRGRGLGEAAQAERVQGAAAAIPQQQVSVQPQQQVSEARGAGRGALAEAAQQRVVGQRRAPPLRARLGLGFPLGRHRPAPHFRFRFSPPRRGACRAATGSGSAAPLPAPGRRDGDAAAPRAVQGGGRPGLEGGLPPGEGRRTRGVRKSPLCLPVSRVLRAHLPRLLLQRCLERLKSSRAQLLARYRRAGEHGRGRARGALLAREVMEEEWQALRSAGTGGKEALSQVSGAERREGR